MIKPDEFERNSDKKKNTFVSQKIWLHMLTKFQHTRILKKHQNILGSPVTHLVIIVSRKAINGKMVPIRKAKRLFFVSYNEHQFPHCRHLSQFWNSI